MAPPPRPPASSPSSLFPLPLLLLLILLLSTATAAAPAPSSGLLVLDPQPEDPCSRTPGECGTLDSCASALRVDVFPNGTAALTPAGVDYTLTCNGDVWKNRGPPSSDPRGSVEVKCALMGATGAAAAWPPADKGGSAEKSGPALVFADFAQSELPALGRGGEPLPEGARTAPHSLLAGPDSRMTSSALFSRAYFHAALCGPFYCPTPGCAMGRPYPLVVLTPGAKGSGRVRVFAGERGFSCDKWSSPGPPFPCGKTLAGVTYRVAEGVVLGERAGAAAAAVSAKDCPVGTGPGKVFVPPAPAGAGGGNSNDGGVAPGPRPACVAACDGAAPNANASTVSYPLAAAAPQQAGAAPPPGACRACRAGFAAKGPACAACAGWQGPCCAPGYGPAAAGKDCPACPPGFSPAAKDNKKAFARLRLAAIVAPNRQVSCLDLYRAAAVELAVSIYPGYLDDAARTAAVARCPPGEITLSVEGASCGVKLRAPECPSLDTRAPEYWSGPGLLPFGMPGTRPFNLTAGGGGAAASSIRRGLATVFWTGRYEQEDGNATVASLEPKGPGGRGLLALRLSPAGCVFRYSVVEGALPGGDEQAGGRAPLPAATAWCPGSAPVKSGTARLGNGDAVPVCVPK